MLNYDLKKMHEWPLVGRAIVVALVSIIILFLGYSLDLSPYRTQIDNIAQQEGDLKRQLQSLIEQQVTIKSNVEHLPELKAKLTEWQKRIVTRADLPALLDDVLKAGQGNRLKIIAFEPSKEIKDGIYFKTPVSIDVVGTYNQISQYISQLANMPKLINIDTVFIYDETPNTPGSNDVFKPINSDDEYLSAEIDIEIYRR